MVGFVDGHADCTCHGQSLLEREARRANRKSIEGSWVDASAEALNTGGHDDHRKGGMQ